MGRLLACLEPSPALLQACGLLLVARGVLGTHFSLFAAAYLELQTLRPENLVAALLLALRGTFVLHVVGCLTATRVGAWLFAWALD